jgi:hypothetical protein
MPHVNTRPIDFTSHINDNGSIITSVKQSIVKTFRALAGKNVLTSQATAFNATAAVPVNGLSFQVKAGKQYRVTGKILVTADATSGSKFGFSLPGSSGFVGQINFKHFLAATMATQTLASTFTSTTGLAGLTLEVDIDGAFVPDVSGLLSLTVGTLTGTTAGSVNVGSNLAVYRTRA